MTSIRLAGRSLLPKETNNSKNYTNYLLVVHRGFGGADALLLCKRYYYIQKCVIVHPTVDPSQDDVHLCCRLIAPTQSYKLRPVCPYFTPTGVSFVGFWLSGNASAMARHTSSSSSSSDLSPVGTGFPIKILALGRDHVDDFAGNAYSSGWTMSA